MTDDDYLTRVAVHGSIPDGVPGDIETTEEGFDAVVEILYVRSRKEYSVHSRHDQTFFIDHGDGRFDEFDDALASAIETVRDEELPLLQRVYTYGPENGVDELGSGRIPIPWDDDETSGI